MQIFFWHICIFIYIYIYVACGVLLDLCTRVVGVVLADSVVQELDIGAKML